MLSSKYFNENSDTLFWQLAGKTASQVCEASSPYPKHYLRELHDNIKATFPGVARK